MEGQGGATVIAKGVKVEGEFSSQSDVLIEGEVHGTLNTAGTLTVGPEAKIKADINANEAIVSGTVEGNLNIAKRLEIKSSAKILGDVTTEAVAIEVGAVLAGRVMVGAKGTMAEKPSLNGRRPSSASPALATSEK